MDGALPLSLSWAEAIPVHWPSSVKCFNKISIFLPVSPVSYVGKKGGLYCTVKKRDAFGW